MIQRVLFSAAVATVAFAFGPASASAAPATDGPGAMSHFALARKDCVGTARNDRSKVWFTVADGVLSDVYYPTNDNTENETLQYVVTDGSTFTDLQTRDMTYSVQALDARALTCRVTAKAKSGRYRIVTDYLTDPDRADGHPALALRGAARAPRTTALRPLRPDLNGNGGGAPGNGGADSGRSPVRRPHAARRHRPRDGDQRRQPRLRAARLLGARRRRGFTQVSNGYAGAAERRPQAARRRAQAHRHLHGRRARQPRPDRTGRPRPRRRRSRSRSASARPRRRRVSAARGTLREPLG